MEKSAGWGQPQVEIVGSLSTRLLRLLQHNTAPTQHLHNASVFLPVLEAGVQDQGAGRRFSPEASLPSSWTADFSVLSCPSSR